MLSCHSNVPKTFPIHAEIMLRNLDALTNEEGVLTALQEHLKDLSKTISKVIISRDTLTQASRGICYLHFDTLVDSMNVHNALTSLDPPLTLDDRAGKMFWKNVYYPQVT